jgi:DNA-binding NarL/FixJ family response regulator
MATFLIVDDHPRFRDLVSVLLCEEGHEVVGQAANGDGAVEAARRLEPDVVLLDVHLPDVSGFEVASRIAGLDRAPAVWMTSTHDGSDYEQLAHRHGARGFVPKQGLSAQAIHELVE